MAEDISKNVYPDKMLQVPAKIEYQGQTIPLPRGTTIGQLMAQHPHENDDQVFAAVMNNRVVSLSAQILRSGTVEPVRYRSAHGARIYRRHLTTMLYEVFLSRHRGCRIRVGQAISEGYYFEVQGIGVESALIAELKSGMDALIAERRPFVYSRVPVEEARRLFHHKGSLEKRQVLDNWPTSHVGIVALGDFVDFALGPVAPHTGYFSRYELFQLQGDLVLQFPDPGNPELARIEDPQPKLYALHKQAREWSDLLGVSHVGELNAACIEGSIREVIQVAEGLHEKNVASIADEITNNHERRLVLIAGPSAAGKTTFTKRLSIQLRVNGIRPVSISLDNYYVDRVTTPVDENGEYDFEAMEAVDLELFNEQLRQILDGKEVATPRYNFSAGRRAAPNKWRPVKLEADQVLIIEGIHGLNDALTPAVPAEEKFRLYVNALNPLAIDEHNRLHTSDIRLIRRIVRDRHYRGYSASETIASWHLVRRGERRHIFPYQELADVMFDSSLIYEFSVLKVFAERYLLEVPRSDPAFAEAYRLRKFLAMFVPILPGDVPHTSLVREFIGGSGFSY